MRYPTILLALLLALTTSGCVMGRRTISLSVASANSYPAKKGTVHLASVTDARVFQNKPSEPSTPSIDGDVNTLTKEQKASMIGRQRNGYGRAMGDIALAPGQSVPKIVRELVAEGFKRRGYEASNSPGSGNSANVTIDECWAWFSPGMWSIGFDAQVRCTLTLRRDGHSSRIVVQGHGYNGGQVASDTNWRQAYERAFEDFLEKFDKEAAAAGF